MLQGHNGHEILVVKQERRVFQRLINPKTNPGAPMQSIEEWSTFETLEYGILETATPLIEAAYVRIDTAKHLYHEYGMENHQGWETRKNGIKLGLEHMLVLGNDLQITLLKRHIYGLMIYTERDVAEEFHRREKISAYFQNAFTKVRRYIEFKQ
jgi:hypothetical protein